MSADDFEAYQRSREDTPRSRGFGRAWANSKTLVHGQ